jgi:uncharacterized short protein YbdD (DUF466 family)
MPATCSKTFDELYGTLSDYTVHSAEYVDKMLHKIPDAPVVDRFDFVPHCCKDKTVISFGHSGSMAERMETEAKLVYGVDIDVRPNAEHYYQVDLDDEPDRDLPDVEVDLVVCGEVIEHLGNPLRFLKACRRYDADVVITCPNAFGTTGHKHVQTGRENVNLEHVAYYSFWTLKQLVERAGYSIKEWCWADNHGAKPMLAEGLIMIVR